MNASEAIDLCREAVVLMLVLGAPVLLTGLIVGLVVGLLQAATQVPEYTLSFIPKIVAMLLAGVVTGPWVLQRLVEFSRGMFGSLP
jgi:flagellar biosynthetic protein FliQ